MHTGAERFMPTCTQMQLSIDTLDGLEKVKAKVPIWKKDADPSAGLSGTIFEGMGVSVISFACV